MSNEPKIQTQFRLVLRKEAIESLKSAVEIVNDGFTAGSVSKEDLAGYLFKNLSRFLKPAEVARIRDEFFDEKVALDSIVKQSLESGKFPDEIRKLLKDQHRASSEVKLGKA